MLRHAGDSPPRVHRRPGLAGSGRVRRYRVCDGSTRQDSTAWRDLLDQALKRRVDCILIWKLDRAFRSVAHMATTVEQLRRWNVGLRLYSEPWLDTSGSSPVADLMLNILASFAQFEKALIGERVKAEMARAKRQGVHVGRPSRLNGNLDALGPLLKPER